MRGAVANIAQRATDTVREVITLVLYRGVPLLIVDSPPGAGKTWLVEEVVAAALSSARMRVCVVTPRAKQGFDVLERLVARFALPRIEALVARHRTMPATLVGRVVRIDSARNLGAGPGVVVTTAHKLAAGLNALLTGAFDLLIVDEAYQLAAKDFYPIADLAPRILLVGDPGQLDPLVTVPITRFEGADHKVHWSLPRAILDRYPETPVVRLPATRRLVPDTTSLIQPGFYPDLPFVSLADPSQRQLQFPVAGMVGATDDALDLIAGGASVVAVLLPERGPTFEEYDLDVAAAMADIAHRVLQRQARSPAGMRLSQADIGCIDPHVASGETVAARLRMHGSGRIWVNTPEQWQGLQTQVTVVKHPLTEANGPSGFDLEAGRWCVSLTRHTHACVIVGRASIGRVLADYTHECGETPSGAVDDVWAGYRAHATIWSELDRRGRLLRL
jgi:AAA domain